MKINRFLSKGVDKLMEDLLKCVSRAEPSRAEPMVLPFYMDMLAVFLCWKAAVVLVALKERFVGIFCPLERCFGAASIS